MKIFYTFLVLLVGSILAIQGSINTQLTSYLKHPMQGALVNFTVGFLSLIALNLIFRTQMPDWEQVRSAPWYLFIGGILGSVFVSSVIFFIPQIGVTTVLAAAIAGQLITAALIDHFGFLGLAVHPISSGKIVGIVLLLVGIFLIQKY
ncbi:MAG: DMT family transporter [Mangrovibacterium sp.]